MQSVLLKMVLLAVIAFAPAAATELSLSIFDKDTGEPLPARVLVRSESGSHVPPDVQVVQIGNDRWFAAANGQAKVLVPEGKVEIRVEHGTEYRPVKTVMEVKPGPDNTCKIELSRWVNMRERGYVCGENHLHLSVPALADHLAAEGLDFGTSLQWWNGARLPVPEGEGFIRILESSGKRFPVSVYDFELEYNWGAAYVLGMPSELMTPVIPSTPNMPILRDVHKAGALVCYQGGWSREVLPDALLGYVDVVNVCNNNFHRHRYQPRTQSSNMLNVEGLPVYPDTPEGMMKMNTDTYYRLLNCGLRLAAGAGSATGAKRNPVGYNRAYVKAGENPTLPQFLEAWRQGKNFVTNGPMIFLTVNGKEEPGDTIAFGKDGGEVEISVEAISEQPLTDLEIIGINGKALEAKPKIEGTRATLNVSTKITESSWIAARCTEEDRLLTDEELSAYDSPGTGPANIRMCRLRFAHTSPIYVTVDGKKVRVHQSIDEARKMLDAFQLYAAAETEEKYKSDMADAIKTARERLLSD